MNYFKIDKFDIVNGYGVGAVLWVAGCDIHCPGCHNPNTWNPNLGYKWTEETETELLNILKNKYLNRLTISGGHPLMPCNQKDILELVKKIKTHFPHIQIWLYTGYVVDSKNCQTDMINNIFQYCDIIVDGPFISQQKTFNLAFRGSLNQRVVDIQYYLRTGKIKELF